MKEIQVLMDRRAFQIVLKQDISDGVNIREGWFVLCMKDVETNKELYKTRFVVQRHTDTENNMLVYALGNARQHSLITNCYCCDILIRLLSEDISQEYLQSASQLSHEDYSRCKQCFKLRFYELLKLLKPVYGCSDSGDYWHATMAVYIKNNLTMTQLSGV